MKKNKTREEDANANPAFLLLAKKNTFKAIAAHTRLTNKDNSNEDKINIH